MKRKEVLCINLDPVMDGLFPEHISKRLSQQYYSTAVAVVVGSNGEFKEINQNELVDLYARMDDEAFEYACLGDYTCIFAKHCAHCIDGEIYLIGSILVIKDYKGGRDFSPLSEEETAYIVSCIRSKICTICYCGEEYPAICF